MCGVVSAASRNPSAQARDLWVIPAGDGIISLGGVDTGGASGDELCVMKDEGGDYNFYLYNLPEPGDATYWQTSARNPSPLARDFWVIPAGNGSSATAY